MQTHKKQPKLQDTIIHQIKSSKMLAAAGACYILWIKQQIKFIIYICTYIYTDNFINIKTNIK